MISNCSLNRYIILTNKTLIACFVIYAAVFADRPANADKPFIILQSTTSTQNSGLYDYLLPHFTAKSGIEVRVVAVGTGQALRNAEKCDGDILITHSKVDEVKFVESGFGTKRSDLMYNDFVVLGQQMTQLILPRRQPSTRLFNEYQIANLHLHHAATIAVRTRQKNASGNLPTESTTVR